MQRQRFESPAKSLRRLKWEAFWRRFDSKRFWRFRSWLASALRGLAEWIRTSDELRVVLQIAAVFAVVIAIVVALAVIVLPMEYEEREKAKALCDSTPGASWAVSSGTKWMCIYPPEKVLDDAGGP